jgi:protein-S-isoprenylcysteine O-methyltransferase Ste14
MPLYKHRGLFSAIFAVFLFLQPAAPFLRWRAVTCVLASFVLRVWARRHIGAHSRGDALACPQWVKSGPYAVIRHPLYVSNFLFATGLAYFHLDFGFLLLGYLAAFALFLAYLACKENEFIRQKNPPVSTAKPVSVWVAIKSDRWTWVWWGVLVMVAIFLNFFHA